MLKRLLVLLVLLLVLGILVSLGQGCLCILVPTATPA
jgi:hypothetical protein